MRKTIESPTEDSAMVNPGIRNLPHMSGTLPLSVPAQCNM